MNVKTILDRTVGVKKIKVNLVEVLILFLVGITFFLVSAFNFARGRFEWDRLKDGAFWVQYITTMGLAVFVFFLMLIYTKGRLKVQSADVARLSAHIARCSESAQANASEAFDEHITNINNDELRKHYLNRLYTLMTVNLWFSFGQKAKDRTLKKWQARIGTAGADYKTKRIRCRLISVNLFHTGYSSKQNSLAEKMHYTGREDLNNYLLPAMFFGLFFMMLILSFRIEGFSSGLDVWVQLISRLITMSLFVVRGQLYGEYSIKTVYIAVLKNRRSFLVAFLKSQGYDVNFPDENLEEVQNGEHEQISD